MKLTKGILMAFAFALTATVITTPAFAESPTLTSASQKIYETVSRVNAPTVERIDEVTVYLDGKQFTLTDPLLMDKSANRTYLPVREISELLGSEVGWEQTYQLVTVEKDSNKIELIIQKPKGAINGEITSIDPNNSRVAPFIYQSNARTYLPIRYLAEALGVEPKWFPNNGKPELHLTTPGHTAPTAPTNPYTPPATNPSTNQGGQIKHVPQDGTRDKIDFTGRDNTFEYDPEGSIDCDWSK